MEVMEAIRTRRSIRAYQNQTVLQDKLLQVLEAARLAPSAANKQLWKFVVVQEPDLRQALVGACRNQQFVGQAGAVIACCCTDANWKWADVDVAIAIDHMTLAAHSLGLGTCWIGAFEPARVKELLGIPADVKVVALLTLGIPAQEGTPRPRKSLSEIVCYDRYQ